MSASVMAGLVFEISFGAPTKLSDRARSVFVSRDRSRLPHTQDLLTASIRIGQSDNWFDARHQSSAMRRGQELIRCAQRWQALTSCRVHDVGLRPDGSVTSSIAISRASATSGGSANSAPVSMRSSLAANLEMLPRDLLLFGLRFVDKSLEIFGGGGIFLALGGGRQHCFRSPQRRPGVGKPQN